MYNIIRDIILNKTEQKKTKTKTTLCWLRAEGPESTNKMCEMTGIQPGVRGVEPPDKLENSAGGARRATRDECQRHVRKLVNKVSEDGHVSVGVRQSSAIRRAYEDAW